MHHRPANTGKQWIRLALICCVLVAALFLTGFHLSGGLLLRVVPVRGTIPLAEIWLAPGDTFTLRYFHSVENAPIWETHSVDADGRIFIEEECYLKFGAGMGKMPGVGRMVQRGPYEVIEQMHMPTGDFILRIGSPGVDHTLIWCGNQINLSTLAPHTAVRFSAQPASMLYRIWHQWFRRSDNVFGLCHRSSRYDNRSGFKIFNRTQDQGGENTFNRRHTSGMSRIKRFSPTPSLGSRGGFETTSTASSRWPCQKHYLNV